MRHDIMRKTFIAFHLMLGLVVFIQSASTVLHSVGLHQNHPNMALAAFASAEGLAALLFLLPSTLRYAGAVLLLIFAFAILAHGLEGQFLSTLLVYLAGVAFVMAHGSAYGRGSRVKADA